MKTQYAWLPMVALLVIGLLMMQAPVFGGEVEKTFKVKGFMCGGCPMKVEKKLKSLEGVKEVSAKHPEGTVHVVFDSSKVTEEQIKKAIEEAGFKVAGEKSS